MWFMRQGWGKSLYIFLCTILGVLLLIVLQRSVALIHFILLNVNYDVFSLGLQPVTLELINYLSIAAAVFVGGWYGTWLGLHWYSAVYEGRVASMMAKPAMAAKPTFTKFSPIPEPKAAPAHTSKAKMSWNVDDLMPRPTATMPAVSGKTPSRSGISRASSVTVATATKARAAAKPAAKKTTTAVKKVTKKVAARAFVVS